MVEASSGSAKASNPAGLQPVENNVVTDVQEHKSKCAGVRLCVYVCALSRYRKKVARKYMCIYLEAFAFVRGDAASPPLSEIQYFLSESRNFIPLCPVLNHDALREGSITAVTKSALHHVSACVRDG